jgi:NIMA (never in mitosis gene a)-related kinase
MSQIKTTGKMSNFEVLEKIGEGAFSSVYKIIRKSDQMMYALKKVKINQLKIKEKENALNEIRILASIDHPSIVGYKEAFIDDKDDTLCIVMEFLGGGDVYQKISECKKKRAMIPEKLIWRYLVQMVQGLKHLHSMNIVHRDLKSANVFLSADLKHIKLGDMNVSKIAKNRMVYTQTGTPFYASPEVWRDEPYDFKSDVWSLGCVLYEMCNRCPPFNGKQMEELFAKVQKGHFDRISNVYSEDLNSIIAACLRVNPQSRPSCEQILEYPIVRHLMSEMECETQTEPKELLGTIRLPSNLKDLNNYLPEPKYNAVKKRSHSAQPARSFTRVEPRDDLQPKRRDETFETRNPVEARRVISPRLHLDPNGREKRAESVNRSSEQYSGNFKRVAQDLRVEQVELANRIEKMRSIIERKDKPSMAIKAESEARMNLARRIQNVYSPKHKNSNPRLFRPPENTPKQSFVQHYAGLETGIAPSRVVGNKPKPYLDERVSFVEQYTDRVPSYEQSRLLREQVLNSPKQRDSSNSRQGNKSRLLAGMSPTNKDDSMREMKQRLINIDSGIRSIDRFEDEFIRKMEEDLLRKQKQLAGNQGPGKEERSFKQGVPLKKHPKVISHLVNIEKAMISDKAIDEIFRNQVKKSNEELILNRRSPTAKDADKQKKLQIDPRLSKESLHLYPGSASKKPVMGLQQNLLNKYKLDLVKQAEEKKRVEKSCGRVNSVKQVVRTEPCSGKKLPGSVRENSERREMVGEGLERINNRLDMMTKRNPVPNEGVYELGIRRRPVVSAEPQEPARGLTRMTRNHYIH